MKALQNQKLWPIYLLIIAIFAYWPVLGSLSPINPDAQYIFPVLLETQNLFDYFDKLLSYQTLDFQPVRDLSFYVDILFYKNFLINSSIYQNIIFWVMGCLVLGRIIKKVVPTLKDVEIFFIIVAFLVYPLFSQAVSWGVARKHILAFLFILIATNAWISKEDGKNGKSAIYSSVFYLLSVLSQPITLLWPVWAIAYDFLSLRSHRIKRGLFLIPAFAILLTVTYFNFQYYQTSPLFAKLYGTKTDELFEISDKVLALGHYLYQMTAPYLLSYSYTLGHWSTLAGLGVLGILSLLLIKFNSGIRYISIWALYSLLPLAVVISKSRTLYDTYLLVPTVGLLFLLLGIKEKLPSIPSLKLFFYGGMIIVWFGLTNYESSGWMNEVELTKRSFERRPSCLTSFQYLRMSYENNSLPTSPDAKRYLYNYKCEAFEMSGDSLLNLQTYLLYYEEDFTPEVRINKLSMMAQRGFLPGITLIAIYLKFEKFPEADKAIEEFIQTRGNIRYRNEYIPIVNHVVYPYCFQKHNVRCTAMLKPFIIQPNSILYK